MASHPNTAICVRNTYRVLKKQWSQCFNGNVHWQWLWRLCCRRPHVMAQENFWRKLHLRASQYHPIYDMAVILEICKSIVLHVIRSIIYIYIYVCVCVCVCVYVYSYLLCCLYCFIYVYLFLFVLSALV